MNGTPKDQLVGDMLMRDADAVSCSIIYGQDNRSPITPQTTHVLYVAFAPAGVSVQAVESQLQLIQDYIRLCSPPANVLQSRVLSASQ